MYIKKKTLQKFETNERENRKGESSTFIRASRTLRDSAAQDRQTKKVIYMRRFQATFSFIRGEITKEL
jgi:hypothetical protein